MAQLMPIVSFNDLDPAETLAGRLREAGYQAEVRDESAEQKWKLFNLHPRAHIQVIVPETQAEAATQKALDLDRTEALLAQAVRCPECGSMRIEYPQFSRRTIMGALPSALAAAGVIEREFYCENCHFTWPAEPPEPGPDLNILGWSKYEEKEKA
jgi:hypothetical protein